MSAPMPRRHQSGLAEARATARKVVAGGSSVKIEPEAVLAATTTATPLVVGFCAMESESIFPHLDLLGEAGSSACSRS